MEQQYGDDFITITDEDGTNYELEVLSTLDYNGSTYLALCAADDLDSDEETDLEVSFLKVVEEDGEEILATVADDEEADKIFDIVMERVEDMYEDEE